MIPIWFENALKNCTCIECKKRIYKHEARCRFHNGGFKPNLPAIRFLCLKCANKELKRIKKELEKAKAHQRKYRKDILNEKVLDGI